MMKQLPIIERDPYLEPYSEYIRNQQIRINNKLGQLSSQAGSLADFANGHRYFGLSKTDKKWIFREWAPNATGIKLVGDFSSWEKSKEFAFSKIAQGKWELKLDLNKIKHQDRYKLWIEWEGGADFRIPLFANRVIQDEATKLFDAQVWNPPLDYQWKHPLPGRRGNAPLLIYEAHVGMGTAMEKVGSYNEFTQTVLPRIADLGYNTVQLMAIQEHPYYGSFGYHVSNFFAPSSRFGTPEDLKSLIDTAHGLGIRVVMDLVHSHAVKNTLEGPGLYDGSPGMLFHTNHRREHVAWDSLCFDYGKDEVIHFLLSNCKYWMEEFRFDGFRFDGITSMLYIDHGLERSFSSYEDYFSANTDQDAVKYLGLANLLIHDVNPEAITIAEDMSGMPGLGVKLEDGGVGFDYRLAMGVPDFWIRTIKEKPDEAWNIDEIFYELTNYRSDEKVVSYAESHDQALVGDKTIIFRLADKDMYYDMSKSTPSITIDRAIALHKMIRMVTLATNGGGYLNFMGNEFGHPEWIDFPREGNGWSYKYARRQWQLADDPDLRYCGLQAFDKELISLFAGDNSLSTERPVKIYSHPGDQVLVFERGNYMITFNFNPVNSYTDYGIPALPLDYRIILNSDSEKFGGFGRIDESLIYEPVMLGSIGSEIQLKLYLPSRTGIILEKIPIPRAK